jgi:hypothetical protein
VQRYGTDMPRSVLTMDETGSVTVAGTVAAAHNTQTCSRLVDALYGGQEMTTDELRDVLDARKADVVLALRSLEETGRIVRAGSGRRGDPKRYRLPDAADDSVSVLRSETPTGNGGTETEKGDDPLLHNAAFRSAELAL